MRPRNASPILNKNTKPKIPIAIAKPFFLKKLIIGPPIVPDIHAIKLVTKLFDPNLFCINLSVRFCLKYLPLSIVNKKYKGIYDSYFTCN